MKFNMRFWRLALPCSIALAMGANAASAATFTYSGYSVANEQNISISAPNNISGGMGQITLIGSGANASETILAYCMDIYHYLQGSGTYQIIPLTTAGSGNPNPTLTNAQIGEIGSLIVHGNALINTSYNVSAAVQLAIWKIEYGNSFAYTGVSAGVTNLANTYIGYVTGAGIWSEGIFNVSLLSGRDNQSLVFVDPTPLPATWTMMLIGLAGLGFVICRPKINRPTVIATA